VNRVVLLCSVLKQQRKRWEF